MGSFDSYEIRARVAPSIIVSFPLVVTLLSLVFDTSSAWGWLLGASLFAFAFIYGLSFLVRHLGIRIQSVLWKKWGGAPSVRFLRWQDETFDEELTSRMRSAVYSLCEVNLPSTEKEERDPEASDKKIEQAFKQVRAIVRREDQEKLWNKHNAEYGFNRNLLGSRKVWLLVSILGIVICGAAYFLQPSDVLIGALVLNGLSCCLAIFFGWWLLPKTTKEAADKYAESVWNCFLAIANRE